LLERYVGTLPTSLAEPATKESYAAWRDYDRVTWPEWLLERGASPGAVRLMTQGGDSSALSALYMLRQFAMLRTSSQLFKIAGGMDRLPQAMTASIGDVIRYEAAVVRINRASAGAVSIEYEARGRVERLAASHVVLAIRCPRCGRSSSGRGSRPPRRSHRRSGAVSWCPDPAPDPRSLLESGRPRGSARTTARNGTVL
jgi:hypothetical protein